MTSDSRETAQARIIEAPDQLNVQQSAAEKIVRVPFDRRLESVPPSLRTGIHAVITKTRRDSCRVGPLSQIVHEKFSDSVPPQIRDMIARHLEDFPEEPKEGFNTAEEYLKYNLQMNQMLAEERAVYNQNPAEFHPEDPETPGKKICKVTFTCADGRICPANFLPQDEILSRYATRWLPHAGLVIFPEIMNGQSQSELDEIFKSNADIKEMILQRLDTSLSAKVDNFFKKKSSEQADQYSKLHFELQSHYEEKHFPAHGCGAHKSNFDQAQAETIKDAQLIDLWLKTRYPEQYAKGWFKVYRTTHDTGEGGNIYSASRLDRERVSKEFYAQHEQMFKEAEERFSSPKIEGLPDGVFQEYKENYIGIDEEHHSEQAIRIGDTHFAHTLQGQSVLEISWTNSPKNLYNHILILLGIIEGNFRKEQKNKPAIVHFDVQHDRPDIEFIYRRTKAILLANPDIQRRMAEGSLKIVATETNTHTYVTKEKIDEDRAA